MRKGIGMTKNNVNMIVHVGDGSLVEMMPNFMSEQNLADIEEIARKEGKTVTELVLEGARMLIEKRGLKMPEE
jgi:cbb3-type cytochrome oxidase cytochrome c subunit